MQWIDKIHAAIADPRPFNIEDEFHNGKGQQLIPAAVLITITDAPRPSTILTQRPSWLRAHAGQVAFPGGKIDADDKDAIDAALREAEEELSIDRQKVEILGTGDIYRTGSGYAITPVFGLVSDTLSITPNPDEVSHWFKTPMDFLMNPQNAIKKQVMWQGQMREYYDMQWNEFRIWGVTAGIIANLRNRILMQDK
ncbi:coenzyme A pyrophosphatase [Sphingorhabdus lutea]|uniref:Coenzyme A pyrophosphatase n=1 Tax=Sphingorhabdus lutea TaxID=1913578 RepID=A0A1L3JD52_9SPHN|nr:CoA pyrophosphatase [Sphingorhabdus lutea]APG63019.1 coenzyme A pyrophosphatase [Sphingorhabdus lutea]